MCGACPDWPRAFFGLRSAASHEGTARALVHALKFGSEFSAARPLGCLAAAVARDLPLRPETVVVSVPLHWRRRNKRGFSPAAEIARVVAGQLGLSCQPRLLRRVRAESGVTRTTRGRFRELSGAFRASPRAAGCHVLLVDDVLATGAAMGACARALSRRRVAAVWGVTVTRSL